MAEGSSPRVLKFGSFELDVSGYALRRDGRPIRLERQPMDLLILLATRPQILVGRAEIADTLWGKDVFVDVDTSIHTAVRKVRQALRDSAEDPRFIETVPGRGYRFIARIEVEPEPEASRAGLPLQNAAPQLQATPPSDGADLGGNVEASARLLPGWFTVTAFAALVLAAMAVVAVTSLMRSRVAASPVTLAVLPFANLSGDANHEYLADGLTEEMIAVMGQLDPAQLSVLARTSVMPYKKAAKSVAQIGPELNADFVLESSIRSENDQVRITSRLIRVRDQVQLWSDSFNRAPTSVLGLQQELSAAIGEQIRLRLSPDRLGALARRQTQRPDAYDLYLRGLNFSNLRTPATTRRAIEYFRQATALDPQYGLAWAGIAMALAASPINGDAPPRAISPQAHDAAAHALRAQPELAEAQHANGYVAWMLDWDWQLAERRFRQALSLDPRMAFGQVIHGHSLSQLGRHVEAAEATRRGRTLAPMDPSVHALSSQVAFQARDYALALEHARRTIALDPEFWIGHMMLAQALGELGEVDTAMNAAIVAARFSNQNSKPVSLRGYLLAKAGRSAEAREVISMLEAASQERYVPPASIALILAGLDDRERVFEWLDRAYDARDVHLIYLPVDPKWDAYRRDARFAALLTRCGFGRATG
jgi:TolB-like protein/DNA-binding winged helix-turn-helix (wHTH) protein/Flp pilus assembly protein TadD